MVFSRCPCKASPLRFAPSAPVTPSRPLYSQRVDTMSMLHRAASAPLTSSTVAPHRPVFRSRSGSQPTSSRAMAAAAATFRNSNSANFPLGAYRVDMPSMSTYAPSSRAGSVMRRASRPLRTTTHTSTASISSSVMSLVFPCCIRHVMRK